MPMRVIAKKRFRAMFEPPEKGARATLNPNLSTRLKPTFFRSGPWAAGLAIARRGGRAALSHRSSRSQDRMLRDGSDQHSIKPINCRFSWCSEKLGGFMQTGAFDAQTAVAITQSGTDNCLFSWKIAK